MNRMKAGFYSLFYTIVWKIRYGSKLKIGFPQGLSSVRLEKDNKAVIELGEKIQNRGSLFLGCKQNGRLSVGGHCFFNVNASITCMEQIRIGSNCKFGNNLVIVDHDHNFHDHNLKNKDQNEFLSDKITIGNDVWVGANCVILKGVSIGDRAVIGAGSVVSRNIPSDSIYYEKREIICRQIH